MTEFSKYMAHGWKLCNVPTGTKGPTYKGWNTNPMPADAADGLDGAGLLHALSGTCALDIDNLSAARPWLAERGVDVDALLDSPNAVRIDSGRPGRAKLLYRLSKPLRTFKPKLSGLELRCATAEGRSMQDVLPPSIHPDTKKPYKWLYGEPMLGDWRQLPPIPSSLFALWKELVAGDPAIVVQAPKNAKAKPVTQPAIDLAKLRKAAFRHDPNCEYDEWIKVCGQLNDGTGGAQEGLDIFCEWSKGITRKPYPGDGVCRAHYVSLSSTPGKHIATGEQLVSELPAEADEFPVVEEAAVEAAAAGDEDSAALIRAAARVRKAEAISKLEERLVFVYGAERYFDCVRHKIISSDNAIEHMFTHMMPKVKTGRMSPVKALKESGTKRFVDALAFHPGEKAIFTHRSDTYANTYRNRLPEAIPPTADEVERIHWLFNRIDDARYRDWLLRFYGHVVQHPGVKIKSAPLIWSDTQGNGKTTLVRMIPSLLVGSEYSREVTSSQLNDMFNGYLLDAWHINLTEFDAGSNKERQAISKKVESWIADDVVAVRPMHQAAYNMPNHFFITGSSNADNAASINNYDRKWGIHEMHAEQFTEAEQRWIYNEFLLTPRAAGVLRHFFLNLDISGFVSSARAPETEARREMVAASVLPDQELLQIAFEERSGLFAKDIVVTHEVTSFVHKNSNVRPTVRRIGRLLCNPPFNGKPHQFRHGAGKYRCIVLHNHDHWLTAGGQEIFSHISGEDIDLTA